MVERGAYDAVALGSIPSRNTARLAQLVERTAFNRMVVGSSPTVGKQSDMVQWLGFLAFTEKAGVRFPVSELAPLAQLVEHRAYDAKVLGSRPRGSTIDDV